MNQTLRKELIYLKSLPKLTRQKICQDLLDIIEREKENEIRQDRLLTFDCKNPSLHVINKTSHEEAIEKIAEIIQKKEINFDTLFDSGKRIWRGIVLHAVMIGNKDVFYAEETKEIDLNCMMLVYYKITITDFKENIYFKTNEEFKKNVQKIGRYFLKKYHWILTDHNGNLFM